MQLGVPSKPIRKSSAAGAPAGGEGERPTGGEGEEGEEGEDVHRPPVADDISWSVVVASTGSVALAPDPAAALALTALSDSWEKAAPGRGAKAKTVREGYLSKQAEAQVEVDEAGGGKVLAAAHARLLTAEEKNAMKEELNATMETIKAERELADQKRRAMREVRIEVSHHAVRSAVAERAVLREHHAVALKESALLMSQFTKEPPPPEPPPEKEKGKKGRK